MAEARYEKFDQAANEAVAKLHKASQLNRAVLLRLVDLDDIIERETRYPAAPLPGQSIKAHVALVHYVIRDDRLYTMENLLDLLKHAAAFSAAIAALTKPPSIPAGIKIIVDVIHGLAGTYRRISSAGFKLTPEEFAVFATVKRLGRGSPAAIAGVLSDLDAAFVQRTLGKH